MIKADNYNYTKDITQDHIDFFESNIKKEYVGSYLYIVIEKESSWKDTKLRTLQQFYKIREYTKKIHIFFDGKESFEIWFIPRNKKDIDFSYKNTTSLSPYTIQRDTGLVCVEVSYTNLIIFKRKEATLDLIFKKINKKNFPWNLKKALYFKVFKKLGYSGHLISIPKYEGDFLEKLKKRKKKKEAYFSSKWLAPDGKVFDAGHAGHQDWIDTHEDFLVEKKYLKDSEVDNSSIDYMIEKKDWIRVLDGLFHIKDPDKKTLERVEAYLHKKPMRFFEIWVVGDIKLGKYSYKDLMRTKSLPKLINLKEALYSRGILKKGYTLEDKANLFNNSAEAQRGAPETAMLKIQEHLGGGVFSFVVEHIGDLTHRMMKKTHILKQDAGRDYIINKVEKTLKTLTNEYGFSKEHEENLRRNAEYHKLDPKEFRKKAVDLSIKYAKEHSKLKIYNKVQWLAREAAITLGDWDFDKTINHLKELLKIAKSKDYFENATEIDSQYK